MILFSRVTWHGFGMTKEEMEEKISSAFRDTNRAIENSGITLSLNLVHLAQVSAGVEQARPHGTWWWWFGVAEVI